MKTARFWLLCGALVSIAVLSGCSTITKVADGVQTRVSSFLGRKAAENPDSTFWRATAEENRREYAEAVRVTNALSGKTEAPPPDVVPLTVETPPAIAPAPVPAAKPATKMAMKPPAPVKKAPTSVKTVAAKTPVKKSAKVVPKPETVAAD
jgi:hypothetical protein